MTGEVRKADPQARRSALRFLAAFTVLGAVAIVVIGRLRPAAENWVEHDPGSRLSAMLIILGLITALPLLGLAASLWHLGTRVVATAQFPPPGRRVTRDTRLLTGDAARRRGRLAQGFALFFGVAAVGLATILWRLAALW
ncbi:MAG: hypothetical protein R2752_08240 [Vicinamibacterales bacterium]